MVAHMGAGLLGAGKHFSAPSSAVPSADGAPTLQCPGSSHLSLHSNRKKKTLTWDQGTEEELLQTWLGLGT